MKKRFKKPLYLPIALIAVTMIAALIINLFMMTKVNSSQIEELGRMRIELIAADLQNRLGVCTDSLNRIGNRLSDLMENSYTEEDLRTSFRRKEKGDRFDRQNLSEYLLCHSRRTCTDVRSQR